MEGFKMRQAVLLVDDEKSVRTALKRTLRRSNYDCYEAASGQQALEILKTQKINLVLSDQRMPGMSGTELLKIVKDKHPSIKRIMISGHSSFDDLNEAINEASILQFIQKPWRNEELLKVVDEAITPDQTSIIKDSQPVKLADSANYTNNFINDDYALAAQLQRSIKNDELSLQYDLLESTNGLTESLSKSIITWPEHKDLGHRDIIKIANNSEMSRDLYIWYLIKNIDACNEGRGNNKTLIIDVFDDSPTAKHYLQGLFSSSLRTGYEFILRISPDILCSTKLNNVLFETYSNNVKLLLNVEKKSLALTNIENIPVSYIEVNGDDSLAWDSRKIEDRLKLINEAHNMSIDTILSNVTDEQQRSYATTMNFDFVSTQ